MAPENHPYLLVEIGVESTCNATLERINRGHTYECAVSAINTLYNIGVSVGVHIILGLPGESREMMLDHAAKISELPISTIKLHQLQIIKDTPLAALYKQDSNFVQLFTPEEYAQIVADFIRILPGNIAFDRFVSETPPSMLIAPSWGIKPYKFTEMVEGCLKPEKL
jgi:radical SAM protein (TIGR01212 family)